MHQVLKKVKENFWEIIIEMKEKREGLKRKKKKEKKERKEKKKIVERIFVWERRELQWLEQFLLR